MAAHARPAVQRTFVAMGAAATAAVLCVAAPGQALAVPPLPGNAASDFARITAQLTRPVELAWNSVAPLRTLVPLTVDAGAISTVPLWTGSGYQHTVGAGLPLDLLSLSTMVYGLAGTNYNTSGVGSIGGSTTTLDGPLLFGGAVVADAWLAGATTAHNGVTTWTPVSRLQATAPGGVGSVDAILIPGKLHYGDGTLLGTLPFVDGQATVLGTRFLVNVDLGEVGIRDGALVVEGPTVILQTRETDGDSSALTLVRAGSASIGADGVDLIGPQGFATVDTPAGGGRVDWDTGSASVDTAAGSVTVDGPSVDVEIDPPSGVSHDVEADAGSVTVDAGGVDVDAGGVDVDTLSVDVQ